MDIRGMKPVDRSYYRKLTKKSRNFSIQMERRQWCDLYHEHFDWDGKGDENRFHRARHLNALFRALRRARVELAGCNQPYQLFAYVDLKNSTNDALYVHTPNPNGSPFPSPIERISVVAQAPPLIMAKINAKYYEIRRSKKRGESIFYIIPKAVA